MVGLLGHANLANHFFGNGLRLSQSIVRVAEFSNYLLRRSPLALRQLSSALGCDHIRIPDANVALFKGADRERNASRVFRIRAHERSKKNERVCRSQLKVVWGRDKLRYGAGILPSAPSGVAAFDSGQLRWVTRVFNAGCHRRMETS